MYMFTLELHIRMGSIVLLYVYVRLWIAYSCGEYNVCCITYCHMVLYMTGCHKSTCFSTIFFLHHSASIVKRFLLNKRKQGEAMFFALSCFLILSYLFFWLLLCIICLFSFSCLCIVCSSLLLLCLLTCILSVLSFFLF